MLGLKTMEESASGTGPSTDLLVLHRVWYQGMSGRGHMWPAWGLQGGGPRGEDAREYLGVASEFEFITI
jgi:hypothetical protein